MLKSARYTATRPLQIGAALAGAPDDVLVALATYGDAIGTAFQLRDDVLGVFGDSRVTGKGGAEDLILGKRTLLVLRVDRRMPWRDIARVMADDGDDLERLSASLRKRFERVKERLRAHLAQRDA